MSRIHKKIKFHSEYNLKNQFNDFYDRIEFTLKKFVKGIMTDETIANPTRKVLNIDEPIDEPNEPNDIPNNVLIINDEPNNNHVDIDELLDLL